MMEQWEQDFLNRCKKCKWHSITKKFPAGFCDKPFGNFRPSDLKVCSHFKQVKKIRLIKDDELTAIVLLDESELHPNGTVYPVVYVGYGDDIMTLCSMAWIDEQETLKEINYTGETDFKSLYENIMVKEI